MYSSDFVKSANGSTGKKPNIAEYFGWVLQLTEEIKKMLRMNHQRFDLRVSSETVNQARMIFR